VSRYLIDTHALLFWWGGSPRLSAPAVEAIANPDAVILVSAASAWEIATKFRIGKLNDIGDPAEHFPALMQRDGFAPLPVSIAHGLRAGLLEGEHRDPFDRLIAAQGLMEGATVITRDPEFAAFGCKVLW